MFQLRASRVARDRQLRDVGRSFDLEEPAAFVGTIGALGTHVLLLLYSPTCSDCEELMPYWDRVVAKFAARRDLTVLAVADTDAIAPAPYRHYENPAIFFAPKGHPEKPVAFPAATLQAFLSGSDPTVDADLVSFAERQAAAWAGRERDGGGPARSSAPPLGARPPSSPGGAGTSATGAAARPVAAAEEPPPPGKAPPEKLNARLLAVLTQHQGEGTEQLLAIATSDAYRDLPVSKFLVQEVQERGGVPLEPLPAMAARFLDGLPLAEQWAANYAQSVVINTPGATKDQLEQVANGALAYYAKSCYEQLLR